MNKEGFHISERIQEVTCICAREHPIYEQVSNFSIALYVMGLLESPDLMSCQDLDQGESAGILQECFTEIPAEKLPMEYDILSSEDRYLLVFGAGVFPVHFAVLTDTRSDSPYFSKLEFFGSGFDSLEDLKKEYLGKDGVGGEIHFYKMNRPPSQKNAGKGKIYILKDDGSYSVFDHEQSTLRRKEG